MKKLLLATGILCFLMIPAAAQKAPKWMEKSKNAVFTVTTYDKDNRKIHTTNGFFIGENGEALSAYSPFKGAYRATVTTAAGQTFPVACIMGADDLYDVIKFKVAASGKLTVLSLAPEPAAQQTPVYLMPYSTGKALPFKEGVIAEAAKLKEPYSYYTASYPLETAEASAPVMLESGQVLGIAQEDASGKKDKSYIVSAGYANSLKMSTTDAFNTVYTNIGIRKAWPESAEDASVALFLLASSQDAKTYLETLNDFIATFPNTADGYLTRASHYANKRAQLSSDPGEQAKYLNLALEDVKQAAQYSKSKGDVFFHEAKLKLEVAASDTTLADPDWSMDAALASITKAISEEDLPLYRQLEGDIYFDKGAYSSAYESYKKVNSSDIASSSSFYYAAKALENIPGAQISDIIAMLDSTIARMGTPTPPAAAPYILERVGYKEQLNLFAEAVEDYNLYYKLVDGQVNDRFFFLREQSRFKMGDTEGALADIQDAIGMNSSLPDYYAEEGAIYVRMQKYDDALASLQKALDLAPDFAACYRLKGICLVRINKKTEACEAFNKALELKDPLANRLIKEHCQ